MNRRYFLQSASILGAAFYSSLFGKDILSNTFALSQDENENETLAPIRFLVIGDWGTGGSLQREVAAGMDGKAKTTKPQFILSTGDNIYPEGVVSADDPQWKTKYERIYASKSLNIPWFATLGNHDYRGNTDAQIEYGKVNKNWNMPAKYYKFHKSARDCSVDFFALDTQQIVAGKAKEQIEWLDKALASSKSDWKIAFGHVMARSYGVYGNSPAMLKHIKPLFDKYNVDAYICGHDHNLQCIKYPEDKFYQLISGAGGGYRNPDQGEYSLFSASKGGFLYCAASKRSFTVEYLDKNGKQLFEKIIGK